jgi:LPXTG-site transpeptidase (sortase) family protein
MMPTTGEGAMLVPDEPIPEVEAELDATDHERHSAFLAVVRDMVHGSGGAPAEPAHEALTSDGSEEDLGDCLPGLAGVSAGARTERRGRRRRERPRSSVRVRRIARWAVVAALVAGCAALPWAAPQVPDFLAGLVPGEGGRAVTVHDPAVAPPTDAFVGPVGVSTKAGPYDGVRLESAGPPREVVVQRLHVDSTVVPISGQSGTLLPPSDPQVLGWWQEGKPVGAQYGTAVVTGHTVHTGGGALDNLDRLVVGDTVRVRTDRGWITYTVQRNRIYSKDALARDAETLFRQGGTGRLLLITCDDWNGSFYESNAVVVAVPVDDRPFVSKSGTPVPDGGPAVGGARLSGNMERLPGVVTAKMFDR